MKSRRQRAINPAFAAAHGLQNVEGLSSDGANRSNNSIDIVLKRAQDTGKLVASNCSALKIPLPDGFFEFPFGLSRYTEELLTVVDFSDNEERFRESFIDERILRYRSVQHLRFRNCGVKLPESLSFSSLENLTILDLSGNLLDSFDVGFLLWSCDKVSTLVELNLSNNQIHEMVVTKRDDTNSSKPFVVNLPNLRSFNISHNPPLERLFENGNGTISCENLRSFRCHHNPNLQVKSLSTNDDGLPPFLRSSKATLEILDASHNPKMGITSDGSARQINISEYEQLQTVNFAMNKFEKVPYISNSVKTLDLRSNKLKSIEGMFSHVSSSQLVDLILADNYLIELDQLVVEMTTKLQRLDVSSNKIRTLPYQLGFLKEISTLNISGNPVVTKFPLSVVNDSNPQSLQEVLRKRAPVQNDGTSGNSSTRNRGFSNHASSNLLVQALSSKGRKTLDLANKAISTGHNNILEELIQELKASSAIDSGITGQLILDSNRLDALPEDLLLYCLPNVQIISLTNNRFAEVPTSLQACRSRDLKQVLLGKNMLTTEALHRAFWFRPVASSSSSISNGWSLSTLTHLDLSSNKLTSFPIDVSPSVHCFPALELLNLSNNKISSIHDWKRLPESLAILDLSENNIEDIDQLVILLAGGCPRFQRISLMHNNIKRIPTSLGLLLDYSPTVVSLNLQGNPQRAIRNHILERPAGELLQYLSNRLTVDQRKAAIQEIEKQKNSPQKYSSLSQSASAAQTPTSEKNHEQEQRPFPTSTEKPNNFAQNDNDKITINNDIDPMNVNIIDSKSNEEDNDSKLLKELQQSVEKLKIELQNLSLTQAKKYVIKKALAMERSKLIREERRLGIRK